MIGRRPQHAVTNYRALRCPCKIYSDNAALFDAAADVEWLLGAATELVKSVQLLFGMSRSGLNSTYIM